MLHQIKKPERLPVSLAEVKAHLRLDHAHEDEYLQGLIQAATTSIEDYTGRALLEQTWRVIWRRDPAEGGGSGLREIVLPYPPLLDVLFVWALFPENKKKEIKSYKLATNHLIPKLVLVDVYDGLEVEYVVGFGKSAADVPAPLRQVILMLVADWYENRGLTNFPMESSMRDLLRAYRVVGMVL